MSHPQNQPMVDEPAEPQTSNIIVVEATGEAMESIEEPEDDTSAYQTHQVTSQARGRNAPHFYLGTCSSKKTNIDDPIFKKAAGMQENEQLNLMNKYMMANHGPTSLTEAKKYCVKSSEPITIEVSEVDGSEVDLLVVSTPDSNNNRSTEQEFKTFFTLKRQGNAPRKSRKLLGIYTQNGHKLIADFQFLVQLRARSRIEMLQFHKGERLGEFKEHLTKKGTKWILHSPDEDLQHVIDSRVRNYASDKPGKRGTASKTKILGKQRKEKQTFKSLKLDEKTRRIAKQVESLGEEQMDESSLKLISILLQNVSQGAQGTFFNEKLQQMAVEQVAQVEQPALINPPEGEPSMMTDE